MTRPCTVRLRSQQLDWRRIEGDIVALDLRRSEYLSINATGAELWEMLVEGATEESLRQRLCQQFAVDVDLAERDVAAFLAELDAAGLVERA